MMPEEEQCGKGTRQPLQAAGKGASLQNLFHHSWQVWIVNVLDQPR